MYDWGNGWDPAHAHAPPGQRLRRTKSPRGETLRDLRERGSDVCLRRVCEVQVERYLRGEIWGRGGGWKGWRRRKKGGGYEGGDVKGGGDMFAAVFVRGEVEE